MNRSYQNYIASGMAVAKQRKIIWDTPTDERGFIVKKYVWDLSKMAGARPSPRIILRHLGPDKNTLLNWPRPIDLSPTLADEWQSLIKSVLLKKIFVDQYKPSAIMGGVIRPIKAIAVAAGDKAPWSITAEEIRQTVDVAKRFEHSGKLGKNIISVARSIFDQNQLSNFYPITPSDAEGLKRHGRKTVVIRKHLSERKSSNKLPSEDAFWEIVRIAWTEVPVSSFDHARFAMIRILVLCGMRISEVSSIPLDCLQQIGLNPRKLNGVIPPEARTESLVLKHFASKVRSKRQNSVTLFETVQHVPDMFKEAVVDTIKGFASYSELMRERLKIQSETKRIFPEFSEDAIVPAFDFYTRLTGEPFLYSDPEEENLIASWKQTYDLKILNEIERRQELFASKKNLINRVRTYFQMRLRIKRKDGSYERAPFVYSDGLPYLEDRLRYDILHFRVGCLEAFLRRCMPTKLSDLTTLNLKNGKRIHAHEFLFLAPKRALAESRNNRICDVRKYAFIGTIQPADLMTALSAKAKTVPCLYEVYGNDDASRKLSIGTHEFRHLQNTELFRIGVSDAIITKRFNRNSVQQSSTYDHRSLAEDLKAVEIPMEAQSILRGKAAETFKMIAIGMASGPIVDKFKDIQIRLGDEAAYKFLAAEADGLHSTPYGHCINSFTVDPCPKHLECFSGCLHLTRSPLSEHTSNLENIRDRFETLLASIDEHPAPTAAKEKMKEQAKVRLAGIKRMLMTGVGAKVFPNGEDMSRPIKEKFSGPFRE